MGETSRKLTTAAGIPVCHNRTSIRIKGFIAYYTVIANEVKRSP